MKKDVFEYLEDTIVAVSTALGRGAIAIVRLSGREAVSIADSLFCSKSGGRLSDVKKRDAVVGYITEPDADRSAVKNGIGIVDEVLAVVMRNPRSYTGEDMVELNCHGGIFVVNRVLDLMVKAGARLAEPGEFTRRAFLNRKIDLVQAEAVTDIVDARSQSGLNLAVGQLVGSVSDKISEIDAELIEILSHVEALIDFPEEDIPDVTSDEIHKRLGVVADKTENLIKSFDKGVKIRQGIGTVICGRRNVGKSSLLNALSKSERAIVSSVAGTTRDVVTEEMVLNGIPMTLFDTAGFGVSGDFIEQEGIRRSQSAMEGADLLILVIDGSAALKAEDKDLLERLSDRQKIIALNKADLKKVVEAKYLKKWLTENDMVIEVSALTGMNIDLMEEELVRKLTHGEVSVNEDIVISNIRHRDLLARSKEQLEIACKNIKDGLSIEFIADDIKEALEYVSEILGRNVTDDILGRIFERFCIGK